MKIGKIFFFCILCLCVSKVNAQEADIYFPKIGEKIKDHVFTDLVNYPDKSFKISDYQGQWLVMDFWSKTCSGCIASFPHVDSLSQQFQNKAKVMLVGLASTKDLAKTKDLFATKSKRYNLKIPVAFDSLIGKKYDIWGLPAIFVINPEGILVAKAIKLDSTLLAEIMAGKSPEYRRSYGEHEKNEISYSTLPLLTSGKISNGGTDTSFSYRSLFAKWNITVPTYQIYGFEDQEEIIGGTAEAIGIKATELFRIAYFGRPFWTSLDSNYKVFTRKLIFEIEDSTKLAYFKMGTKKNGIEANRYSYSLKVPDAIYSPENMRKFLLQDLERFMGLKSRIELRKIEIYKLVVTDANKARSLKTKGPSYALHQASLANEAGFYKNEINPSVMIQEKNKAKYSLYNTPIDKMLFLVEQGINSLNHFDYENIPPIINFTGLDYRIDLTVPGYENDLNEILEVLRKNGIDLVKGEMEMKCIVISDAENLKTK